LVTGESSSGYTEPKTISDVLQELAINVATEGGLGVNRKGEEGRKEREKERSKRIALEKNKYASNWAK